MVATDVIEDLPNAMKPFDLIKEQDEYQADIPS
jgi:hypothetical protein